MKPRLLLAALSLLIASGVWAQVKSPQAVEPTVGIGRLQISLNNAIPLYKTTADIRAFDTLNFSKVTDGIDKGRFIKTTKSNINIYPLIFHSGDSYDEAKAHVNAGLAYIHPTLVFRVVALVKGGFEIVLNEQTYETCIIKKDKTHTLYTNGTPYWTLNHSSESSDPAWFLYETWASYLKRLTSVNITNPKLYDNPDGKLVLAPGGNLSFQVVHAINDWVKVRLTGEQRDGVRDEAWVRWTDGENILLTPVEEIYY